jgi:hypothetical protein
MHPLQELTPRVPRPAVAAKKSAESVGLASKKHRQEAQPIRTRETRRMKIRGMAWMKAAADPLLVHLEE